MAPAKRHLPNSCGNGNNGCRSRCENVNALRHPFPFRGEAGGGALAVEVSE